MTSARQIAANRSNAAKSTGPTTEQGKQRSRRNALRHGLTAETVISTRENAQDQMAFEGAIAADSMPNRLSNESWCCGIRGPRLASTKEDSQNAISKLTFQSDHSMGAGHPQHAPSRAQRRDGDCYLESAYDYRAPFTEPRQLRDCCWWDS
jgi:hypothetical protein